MESETSAYESRPARKLQYTDYAALLNKLESEVASKPDIYDVLMREQNTLNILDRIAAEKQQNSLSEGNLFNMSVFEVFKLVATTWKEMLHDLAHVKSKSINSFVQMLLNGERKIVFGLTCVMIAVFIFFVEISS
jgi:hypothetical protein